MKPFLLDPFSLILGKKFGKAGPRANAIFFLWTVVHKKCWTADRLARKGLNQADKFVLFVTKQEKQLITF